MTSAVVTDGRVRPTAEADLRGDRITRQMVRLERDVGISIETIAPFIRFWLMATPSLPEQTQAAARAKGGERYEGFMQALGRRLAKGPGFIGKYRWISECAAFRVLSERKAWKHQRHQHKGCGKGATAKGQQVSSKVWSAAQPQIHADSLASSFTTATSRNLG
jgi:hypothetical protein